jgi:deoxyribodipyrimidine photolyase-related protein
VSNLATLLDVEPRALTDWFWVAYADAYDWVVEPNVLGMGTYAVGDLMTTKPYVSGAGYIDKMSDYCRSCRFDPAKTCPITPLYWAFLERHRPALEQNPRLFMPMNALKKRSADKKASDAATYREVHAALSAGVPLTASRER